MSYKKTKQLILASSLGIFILTNHPEEKTVYAPNLQKTQQTKPSHFLPKSIPFEENSLEKAVQENADLLTEESSHWATFKKTLNELSQYDKYLEQASKETGLKENLLYAVFAAESRGNTCLVSKAGATGIAQLKTNAAEEMGLTINEAIDERCDPKKAIMAGARYLKKYHRFGETFLMLAAYNWGIGNTLKLVEEHGATWNSIESHIPKETRGYIIRVLSREKVLNKKGFDF